MGMRQATADTKNYYGNLVAASLDFSKGYLPRHAHAVFSLLGLLTAVSGMVVLLTAGYLKHPTEPFAMFRNFVSSLGWGGNGAHEVFQLGFTVLTLTLLPFILFLIVMLRDHGADHARGDVHELTHHSAGSWYIAAAGMVLLASFVDIRVPDIYQALLILLIHIVGAALFFTFSVIGAMKLTDAMALHGMSSRSQHWLLKSTVFNAVAMGVSILPLLAVSHSAGYFDVLFANGTQFLMEPEQRVNWIKAVVDNYPWIAFFEWAAAFSLLGWIGVTAFQVYRQPAFSSANH